MNFGGLRIDLIAQDLMHYLERGVTALERIADALEEEK